MMISGKIHSRGNYFNWSDTSKMHKGKNLKEDKSINKRNLIK